MVATAAVGDLSGADGDICVEKWINSVKANVAIRAEQLFEEMNAVNFHFDNNREWWYQLNEQCQQKGEISFFSNGYVTSFELLPCLSSFTPINSKDAIIGSEGAIINDLGRAVLLNTSSRHRLDAGFAIAAAFCCRSQCPRKRVICVEDDSALGFSAMNLETMVRCKLPIVIIIVNNNGIYGGFDQETFNNLRSDGD
uniref:2-hydroxyacyl-CoA lyase n=1 Tax=Glossina palpalis gambiensis TaxID=67801 RepID=A0A1B0C4G6_9MUSC